MIISTFFKHFTVLHLLKTNNQRQNLWSACERVCCDFVCVIHRYKPDAWPRNREHQLVPPKERRLWNAYRRRQNVSKHKIPGTSLL